MTPEQIELARHALGLPNDRRRSYRNRFVTGPGHSDYDNWMQMVAAGNARRRSGNQLTGGDDFFWLTEQWQGFVWMNPPFGGRNALVPWLDKFFAHGSGIALTPDRTSAPWWQQFAPRADLILFVAPKIKFIGADGKPGTSPAQGTCLMGAGRRSVEPLQRAQANGLGVLMLPRAA